MTPAPATDDAPFPLGLRVTTKLAIATTLGIALVLSAYLVTRVRRETALFDVEMRRDHEALAHALALSATELAARAGAPPALELIEDANTERDDIEIRWRDQRVRGVHQIHSTVVAGPTPRDPEALVTTIDVVLSGGVTGVIELRESLARRGSYINETIERAVGVAAILIALCAAIIYVTGWWVLGRPMALIVERLRRVGRGDLSAAVAPTGHDEMAMISTEVSTMCSNLAAARAVAEHESRARLGALEQLRHADRLSTVGLLASGIAHELGTPLNVVAARAKMIANGTSFDGEIAADATVIAEQAARITAIIRQLLDFARANHMPKTTVNLGDVARSVERLLAPLAAKNSVAISVGDGVGPLPVTVAVTQMEQAVTNLVVNAIHAQPNGGAVRIVVAASTTPPPAEVAAPAERHPSITVEDDGGGMDDATRDRVFEPFFTTKDVGMGTGLGLSVAYGIVREHGGWMTVETEPGKGSRFAIHLPATHPHEAPHG